MKDDGTRKTVNHYSMWKADLEERIGMYCTYCGIPLTHSPQVEHVAPIHPIAGATAGALTDWDNMVLACQPCNGKNGKSNKPYTKALHYRPMDHNTLIPFENVEDTTNKGHMIVQVAKKRLTNAQINKAEATLSLFNWDNVDTRPNKTDFRSSFRWQAKKVALAAFDNYIMCKSSPTFDQTIAAKNAATAAITTGFFSVWVEVFFNEPEVLKWLIHSDIFPNTHQGSFDLNNTFQPIERNTGQADPI